MPETRWGVSAPDFAVSACAGVHRGARGVNPAVSRRAGPSSARNERKRLSEPVLLFLRDNRTCPRNVRTVFTLK